MNRLSTVKTLAYLIFIIAVALFINVGPILSTVKEKMQYALFYWVLLATCLLLILYISWINRLHVSSSNMLIRLTSFIKQYIPVVLFHIVFLQVLIGQRTDKTLMEMGYFKRDFWFFCLPLFLYILLLHIYPRIGWSSTKELSDLDLLADDPDNLLALWEREYYMPALKQYFEYMDKDPKEDADFYAMWELICVIKQGNQLTGYFQDGSQWLLDSNTLSLKSCNWLVKINHKCYINMLYSTHDMELQQALINDKAVLELFRKDRTEDRLFFLSRRMKSNFTSFWRRSYLQQLDVDQLYTSIQLHRSRSVY